MPCQQRWMFLLYSTLTLKMLCKNPTANSGGNRFFTKMKKTKYFIAWSSSTKFCLFHSTDLNRYFFICCITQFVLHGYGEVLLFPFTFNDQAHDWSNWLEVRYSLPNYWNGLIKDTIKTFIMKAINNKNYHQDQDPRKYTGKYVDWTNPSRK